LKFWQLKSQCTFQWLAQIEKVEALRTAFAAGKVPSDVNEETWTSFKRLSETLIFQNSFIKTLKKDQNDNLARKMLCC
jgi:hypothetical protein